MQIGLLGPFEVRLDGGAPADVPGPRLCALLAALALEAHRTVPKTALIDWIWGEHPPADASNALQRLASRLRKALPPGTVEGRPEGYRLAVDPDAVDAVRFERLARGARDEARPQSRRRLREALALWRGTALQDIGLPDSPALDAAAARLEALRLTTLEDRYDAELDLGDGAALVTELTELVAAHPMRERLAAALMRALAATGRTAEALLVYQRTGEALAETLGADPSPELSALHLALLRGEQRHEDHRRTNLREELTGFIGEDAEITAVGDLVAAHRLTTLTGPGGSGKTRLASETARALLHDFPDGAWMIELASIGADGEVAQAALTALDLRDALHGDAPNEEPLDRLIAALREREALLVLDNCEHVIEAAADFAHRLLGACRGLRILATSREPLGITGEALRPVPPLALPEEDAAPAAIAAAPAVRLLRDRAGAVRSDFADDAPTLATMARVCRALDGMPLAIELAAARLRTMSLDQLAGRLDDRFRLLTGGSRTALPRHRTLRAVVDWSWEPLSEAERAVLRRLAVFSGGTSLEAAERVCSGGPVEPGQVLDLLTSLAEKSLLVPAGGDGPRYRMLGTIKEYAAQRLAEAGEADAARRAHLAWCTELAETAEPRLRGAEQLEWLTRLEAEHAEIGAAMRWALAAGEAQAAMRLAAGAGFYWWLGRHRAEGVELVTAAASLPGEVDDEAKGMVYTLLVAFLSSGGLNDEHQAEEWIHKAYAISLGGRSRHPLLGLIVPLEHMLREPGSALSAWEPLLDAEDPWVRALARFQLGKMRITLGHGGPEADAHLEKALAEFRALGERFGISIALTELADRVASRGRIAAACEHYEQAIAAMTEVGATDDAVRMLARQAQLHRLLGDEDASASAMAEAQRRAEGVTWPETLAELALAKARFAYWSGDAEEAHRQLAVAATALGDKAEQANVLAFTHHLQGCLAEDLDEAREHHAAACRAAAQTGYPAMIAPVIAGVADLALRRDEPEQAARLLAASTAVRGLADRSDPDLARLERETRSRLGETRYAEAARQGTETDWGELVAVTLAS